jgi:hypothetical protein
MSLALGLSACAGNDAKRGAHRGKSLSIAPVDTALVRVDSSALDDVLEVFPDDGLSLSGPRILPLHFEPRFRRQVERRLERAGLRLHAADTAPRPGDPRLVDPRSEDTLAAASSDSTGATSPRVATDPADPAAKIPSPEPMSTRDSATASPARPSADFVLTLRTLRVHRGAGELLVPKVGNLNVRPLYFTGEWELGASATGQVVIAGRFQMVVTTHRRPTMDEWRKAFDEAARQVMAQSPFRR